MSGQSTSQANSASNTDNKLNKHGDPKRPLNAFMLYMRDKRKELKTAFPNPSNLHTKAGELWSCEPEEIKQKYKKLYELEKIRHSLEFPDYKYRPHRKVKSPLSGSILDRPSNKQIPPPDYHTTNVTQSTSTEKSQQICLICHSSETPPLHVCHPSEFVFKDGDGSIICSVSTTNEQVVSQCNKTLTSSSTLASLLTSSPSSTSSPLTPPSSSIRDAVYTKKKQIVLKKLPRTFKPGAIVPVVPITSSPLRFSIQRQITDKITSLNSSFPTVVQQNVTKINVQQQQPNIILTSLKEGTLIQILNAQPLERKNNNSQPKMNASPINFSNNLPTPTFGNPDKINLDLMADLSSPDPDNNLSMPTDIDLNQPLFTGGEGKQGGLESNLSNPNSLHSGVLDLYDILKNEVCGCV